MLKGLVAKGFGPGVVLIFIPEIAFEMFIVLRSAFVICWRAGWKAASILCGKDTFTEPVTEGVDGKWVLKNFRTC